MDSCESSLQPYDDLCFREADRYLISKIIFSVKKENKAKKQKQNKNQKNPKKQNQKKKKKSLTKNRKGIKTTNTNKPPQNDV